jgi:thiamine biosynthesis lipoprotein
MQLEHRMLIGIQPFVVGLLCNIAVCDDNAPAVARWEFSQVHMGTRFRFALYAPDRATANEASTAAYASVAKLNRLLSDYDEDSEVRRLCRDSGPERPIRVSRHLFDVLAASQQLAQASNGALDVTVGPYVGLWRKTRRSKQRPTAQQIEEAGRRVGYQRLALDVAAQTVRLQRDRMRIDLGAIAKGYAADVALKVLAQHGIKSALIDAGGDIVCSNAPPGKSAWVVAVGKSTSTENGTRTLIQISNAAVATSGDQFQFVEIDGERYSHIVDPRTGMGLTRRRNVTVVAKSGMIADGLASAICVMGKQGFKLLPRYSAAALIVEEDPAARMESETFADFRYSESSEDSGAGQ